MDCLSSTVWSSFPWPQPQPPPSPKKKKKTCTLVEQRCNQLGLTTYLIFHGWFCAMDCLITPVILQTSLPPPSPKPVPYLHLKVERGLTYCKALSFKFDSSHALLEKHLSPQDPRCLPPPPNLYPSWEVMQLAEVWLTWSSHSVDSEPWTAWVSTCDSGPHCLTYPPPSPKKKKKKKKLQKNCTLVEQRCNWQRSDLLDLLILLILCHGLLE